jgi:hypothetical protein
LCDLSELILVNQRLEHGSPNRSTCYPVNNLGLVQYSLRTKPVNTTSGKVESGPKVLVAGSRECCELVSGYGALSMESSIRSRG